MQMIHLVVPIVCRDLFRELFKINQQFIDWCLVV